MRKTLHKLKLDEHGVWLDDMLLQGVRSYDIHYNEKEGIDELTLHMDAVSNRHGNLDSFLEQGGKTDGSDKKLKELTELLNRMIENIKAESEVRRILTPTDWLNIICFIIATIVAIVCVAIVKKMKLPCWKLQISWIVLSEMFGVVLLISRLTV